MSVKRILTSVFVLSVIAFSQNGDLNKPLTNDDVVEMVKAGLSEGAIISAIKSTAHDFKTSAGALIALRQAGVGNSIIEVMVGAGPPQRAPAASGVLTPNVGSDRNAVPVPGGQLTLGSLYVNSQNRGDRLQLHADSSFSLEEGGQSYTGTYSVAGATLKLNIVQLRRDVDIVIQGNKLAVNGGEIWIQPDETPTPASNAANQNPVPRVGGLPYITKADGKTVALMRQEASVRWAFGARKMADLEGIGSNTRISQQEGLQFLVSAPTGVAWGKDQFKLFPFEVNAKQGRRTATIKSGISCTVESYNSQFVKVTPERPLPPGEYGFGPSDPKMPTEGLGRMVVFTFGIDSNGH